MIIKHNQEGEQGFFLAEENGRRMGYLSYEWESPIRFAILHTVAGLSLRGKPVQTRHFLRRYLVIGLRCQMN